MKVVIIGAGLGGLSFGACAAGDGHEVILIDKNKEPGGVLTLARQGGFSFEQGPLALTDLGPEESVGSFLESLGIHLPRRRASPKIREDMVPVKIWLRQARAIVQEASRRRGVTKEKPKVRLDASLRRMRVGSAE